MNDAHRNAGSRSTTSCLSCRVASSLGKMTIYESETRYVVEMVGKSMDEAGHARPVSYPNPLLRNRSFDKLGVTIDQG